MKRPVITCTACNEVVQFPKDYLLGMMLEHKKATGHAEFHVSIPEKMELAV